MNLSKSLYIRGLQCTKSLWLKKNNKELLSKPDASAQAIFATGDEVGALACGLFPDGKEVPFEGSTFEEKIALTKRWIDAGVRDIYEATFTYNDILIMIDILHINDDGSVEIYEVKSSTSLKSVYLHDVSIQYFVMAGLGYDVKTSSLVHINNTYIREDSLDIQQLFTIVDISQEVLALQADIPTQLKNFEDVLEDTNEPEIEIGVQCSNPYGCDAMAYCWRDIPEYSIFNITRLRADKKFSLYQKGILNLHQITDIESFSPTQQVQIIAEQQNKTCLDKDVIKEFLDGLHYPLYHLDFETFQQAIPQWRGIKPFMQIPFQFSLHIEEENGDTSHKEFLAKEGVDPRYALAKRLVEDIPTDVTILAYSMSFEKGVIKKLAAMFEEFAHPLTQIHDNIQDLMIPFQKKAYYSPDMKGSYSIKSVLPSLVPDMAQAYKQLDGVQNGADAMQTYPKLALMEDKKEVARWRESLLKYCELDTLAMVKVVEKLKESVE